MFSKSMIGLANRRGESSQLSGAPNQCDLKAKMVHTLARRGMLCIGAAATIGAAASGATTQSRALLLYTDSKPYRDRDRQPRFWDLGRLQQYYGTDSLLKGIEFRENKRNYIWDPRDYSVRPFGGSEALNLTRISNSPGAGGTPVSVGSGVSLSFTNWPASNCTADFAADPPLLNFQESGRSVARLYAIAHRSPPEQAVEVRPGGDSCRNEHYWRYMDRAFGTPLGGDVFHLTTGAILLAGFFGGYVVNLSAMPSRSLSFGGNLFLIPEVRLRSDLVRAGPDLHRRYSVFVEAMRSAEWIPKQSIRLP